MSVPLFLVDALPDGDRASLTGSEGHHAAAVQRLRVGEQLRLSDGRGTLATATVAEVGRGSLELTITARSYQPAPQPRLVVVQGIAKGDRGELAVQAMTEVGVDEVVPWQASRAVVKWRGERGQRAWQRWQATAREAAKQSRRAWVPVLAPPADTAAVAERMAGAVTALVLHEQASQPLATVSLPDEGEVVVVVGPEGGVAPDELAAFVTVGAVPVRLGPTVLRTSTAGAAALAVLSVRVARW